MNVFEAAPGYRSLEKVKVKSVRMNVFEAAHRFSDQKGCIKHLETVVRLCQAYY